jgi:glycosyltransferase involved in cell wall biosynthesis
MAGGRVLMLAHLFPPAGGSGANRALAMARYLPAAGWRPTVITPEVAWAANRDDGLLREVPATVRVVRTRSLEPRPSPPPSPRGRGSSPGGGGKLRGQVGHLKRFPDAHIGWLPFALAAARREAYEVAYSSSGPFTSHVLGLLLKRMTGKPWVVELRDGWYRWNRAIFPDYPAWRDVLEQRLEAAVIRAADRVVLVTERMAHAFRAQYAELDAEHFGVVSNGFDPAQFRSSAQHEPRDGWTVLHAGALYYGRSVAAFLTAARRLVQSDVSFAHDFRLRLLGTLDAAARAEIQAAGLASHVEVLGQTDHASAIAAMRSADALLLIANTTPGAEAAVPGKLFEYLAVGQPILAVAPRESSTGDVLNETSGGWLADAADPEAILCTLRRAHAERSTDRNYRAIARYDRRRLAVQLGGTFDQVVTSAARRI